jgi:putative RNA 2'-phosphotransferase
LSLVLRHQPETIGLALDREGWADIVDLLARVKWTREELDEIVRTSDKKRFTVSDDGTRIRAAQGHSIEVELGYPPATPPEVLYHGTVAEALPAIREHGLARMKRHAVHLSAERTTAIAVGGRRGKPVVLAIRAGDMHRAGFEFQQAANGVWLTDTVPPEYIE